MKPVKPNRRATCASCLLVIAFTIVCRAGSSTPVDQPVNLALHKPACASSIENDEHNAARANDGDPDTSWCADDEPENGPEWWQVDLEKPADLSDCKIRWPYEGKRYRYKVEGSGDRKTWVLLSDQTNTTRAGRVHHLTFTNATGIRYVKITVTGFDEGCWASICEVKIFGHYTTIGAK